MTIKHLEIPHGMRLHPDRPKYLTASEIPAIAGHDPYVTPLRLWNQKLGLVPPEKENEMMKRGRWLEPAAIEGLHEEHPDWLITRPRKFVVDTERKIGATPDALITRPDRTGTTNCQIKCPGPITFDRYWTGGVPTGYKLQTAMEGMLLGAESNLVCALLVDARSVRLVLYELPRSPKAEATLLDLAADFWRRIEAGDPYPADFTRDAEVVAAMFPQAEPETVIDLSGDNRLPGLLERRAGQKEIIAACKEEIEVIDTEVKAKMGANEVGELPGWRITWKNRHTKGYTNIVPDRDDRDFRVKQVKEDAA
jgi:predicted phage-related endonuclease